MTAVEEMLTALKARLPGVTGDGQDALLKALLADAESLIRALTWRESVPPALQSAQVRLAVVMYNRLGAEGEESRTEGDVTRRFSALPEDLRREIFAYRTART